jgi:hypothetical protein
MRPNRICRNPLPTKTSGQSQSSDNSATADATTSESRLDALTPDFFERATSDNEKVVYAMADNAALVMPDLGGASVRDAWRICARLGLQLEARGEGRAHRQLPAPGASVQSGQTVTIEFARPGE